jgi:hypothetical protein
LLEGYTSSILCVFTIRSMKQKLKKKEDANILSDYVDVNNKNGAI